MAGKKQQIRTVRIQYNPLFCEAFSLFYTIMAGMTQFTSFPAENMLRYCALYSLEVNSTSLHPRFCTLFSVLF